MPVSKDFHPDRLAEDLKAVIDAVNPDEFIIAGHSMGGFTAFKFHEHFGEEYRDRLKGLVIIDSTGTDLVEGLVFGKLVDKIYPVPLSGLLKALGRESRLADRVREFIDNSSVAYFIVRWAAFGKKPPASEVESVREMTFSTPVETIALAAKGCLDFHCEYHLPDVDVPVLLLVGSEDKLTNRDTNRRTCESLSLARLVVFEEAGHCTQLERTVEFNLALGDFLSDCFDK
jgi:pimeloyl-ACP methyl ester carboxylesterase